jgi:sorbitol-specific phosphotransferase system component IIA
MVYKLIFNLIHFVKIENQMLIHYQNNLISKLKNICVKHIKMDQFMKVLRRIKKKMDKVVYIIVMVDFI